MSLFPGLLFSPIDSPPIPNKEDILDRFNQRENSEFIWWKEEILLGERDSKYPFGSRQQTWNTNALENYRGLTSYIDKYLPFSSLYYVALFRATKDIPPHVDANYTVAPLAHHMTATQELVDQQHKLEPVGYRFLINGSRNSLYFCRDYDPEYKRVSDQKKIYVDLPTSTDVFLLKNDEIPHGVDLKRPMDESRLIGFCLGFLDEDKHRKLVESSLEKYSRFLVKESQLSI